MKKLLVLCMAALIGCVSCLSGEGGGSATPDIYEGEYTTYVIDRFGGEVVDTKYRGTTKFKVEIPDIMAGRLDFTFLGVKFAALMPHGLEIKVPSLPYTVEQNEEGVCYKIDVAEAVPMIGDVEREDYTMRNIKAMICANTTFDFELKKRDDVYRVELRVKK